MRVLIIEDEVAAVKRMRKMLLELDPSIELLADLPSVESAVAWFRTNETPDLAFFDVRLADGDSFEVFRSVEVECPVIFVTAYDEHALQAFRVNALDYLLKPIKREELASALARARDLRAVRNLSQFGHAVDQAGQRSITPVKRFLIRFGDRLRVVEPKDIAYIYSQSKNTFLRTFEGRDYALDESLDRLEKQLDPEKFFRLNRQLIVQFRSIKEMLAYSKSRVKVVLEPPFTNDAVVSSERSAEFKNWLGG